MNHEEMKMACTHFPYYQKHCVVCTARHIKLFRSGDKKLTRKLQDAYIAELDPRIAEQAIEMLKAGVV